MNLLIDVGNSRIKWAMEHEGVLTATHADDRPQNRAVVAYATQTWAAQPPPQRVLVCNVAGQGFGDALAGWVRRTWALKTEFVTALPHAYGVTNAYDKPHSLGADRWVALIAAKTLVQGAVCIVDAGTALTFDVLDAHGQHRGGVIVPGIAMMRRALNDNTQGIRLVADAPLLRESALLARDTTGGVDLGAFYATIAVIDRVAHDVALELGGLPTRVLTGGDGPALLPLLHGAWRHEPDLVLRGLAVMLSQAQTIEPNKVRRNRYGRSK